MSKKSKRSSEQGTYALCITAGLMVGIGLGPILGSVWLSAVAGILLGTVVAYYFTRQSGKKKRH